MRGGLGQGGGPSGAVWGNGGVWGKGAVSGKGQGHGSSFAGQQTGRV